MEVVRHGESRQKRPAVESLLHLKNARPSRFVGENFSAVAYAKGEEIDHGFITRNKDRNTRWSHVEKAIW